MARKALEDSLKALNEEMDSVKRRKRSAGLKAASYRAEVEFETSPPEHLYPDAIGKQELSDHQKWLLQEAEKREAVKDTYAHLLDRLDGLQNTLVKDQVAAEAEKAGMNSAFQTAMSAKIPPITVQVQSVPGNTNNEQPDNVQSGNEQSGALEVSADTLLSVAAEQVLSRRRLAKATGDNPDRYQERLETAAKAFIDVIGDLPLRKYLPIHMQDFATVMAEVPVNRSKYPKFKGLSIREIVEKNKKSRAPIRTLSVTTLKGTISEVLNLWDQITAGLEGAKNLRSYRIVIPVAANKPISRVGIPVENLNTWIASAAEKKPREAHKKWLPLVAMLTGMRLAENVWLQVSDFVEIEGMTVIDLRLPLLIDGKKVERELKTEMSPRIVALPPSLIEAGFVDYVRNTRKRGWVFPVFHKPKDPSDAAGKQMRYWMVKLGIHERQRQTFHSLRHNAKHWFAFEFGKRISRSQLGHSTEDVGESYGFEVLQPEEIERIAAMKIPRGLDLSPFLS